MEIKYATIQEDLGFNENFEPIQSWPLPMVLTGLVILITFYLVVVTRVLPTYMKFRAPLQLKNVLLSYNSLQVALSCYTFLIYLQYIYNYGISSTRCPKGADLREVANKIYPYFIAKHLDLFDTIFFVLRKKDSQVTFLHLYHHSTMVTWVWLYYLYYPCDNFVVIGLLNSFVHLIMYTYYGISALGPKYAKYIWWKKHLTKLQLIQFILLLWNMVYLQQHSPCPIPGLFHYFVMTLGCTYLYLFMKFYLNKY